MMHGSATPVCRPGDVALISTQLAKVALDGLVAFTGGRREAIAIKDVNEATPIPDEACLLQRACRLGYRRPVGAQNAR
jgi:hypothetical protein